MSFTSTVKSEISSNPIDMTMARSELSAIIHNIGSISNASIIITTENIYTANRTIKLIKNAYGLDPQVTVRKGYNFNKNYLFIIKINEKVDIIKADLSLNDDIPKNYLYDDTSLEQSYLRGVFISIGSINDPKKSRYHLEFLVNTNEYAMFLVGMLNSFCLNSKIVGRNKKYMVYIKEAEKIGDFLRIIEAPKAVMYYEDIRIYRDHMNMTNRLNNCEQANVDKSILASSEEINDINYLKEKDVYDLLGDKEKEVAEYRLKYPDASLVELSHIVSMETGKPLTKSGLHHRMQKIHALANKLKNK
jgi:DNA-binding protein WhiA